MEWIKSHKKQIFTLCLCMALFICSAVFLVPVRTSAKELHTISLDWTHCLLRYWNNQTSNQIGQNSDGYLELDISASGNLEVGLGIMSFPLHSGMSVESYYGIVPERMKFKTCFYVEEYSGSVPPFSDIPGIELIVDDSNGEVGSAFIPRSAITYSVLDDGFRQVDISFDINLLDYFDEDLFDGADLSDFTFLFYFSSCNNIFYDSSTYRTSVVIRPWTSFMEFTYSMPTIDDEINSNLDDVNSNLEDLKDSLTLPDIDLENELNSNVSDVESDVNSIIDFEQDLQDKIDEVYASYNVNADSMGSKWDGIIEQIGLVVPARDGSLFTAVWYILRDYYVFYLLFELAFIFIMITFLLRR